MNINNDRHQVDSILVPHKAFGVALKRISQCLIAVDGSAEPICIPLVGESGTGKSRVLENLSSQHKATRFDDGMRVPVLRIRVPSNPTVKGLCEVLLRALGDPLAGKGTETNMIDRLIRLMRSTGVKMLMLDEFQHFYDKKSHRVMHHIADTLKIIADESKVALVVSGLQSCMAVLEQNEQLARRSLAPVIMPRFNWSSANDRDEFYAILGAFHQQLSLQYDIPALDSDEMAFRFYCASGGLIGYISKILRQATWNAIDKDLQVITLEDFDKAYRDSVAIESNWGSQSPFQRGFMATEREALLSMAGNVGTPSLEAPACHSSRKRVADKVSAASVLRT